MCLIGLKRTFHLVTQLLNQEQTSFPWFVPAPG